MLVRLTVVLLSLFSTISLAEAAPKVQPLPAAIWTKPHDSSWKAILKEIRLAGIRGYELEVGIASLTYSPEGTTRRYYLTLRDPNGAAILQWNDTDAPWLETFHRHLISELENQLRHEIVKRFGKKIPLAGNPEVLSRASIRILLDRFGKDREGVIGTFLFPGRKPATPETEQK